MQEKSKGTGRNFQSLDYLIYSPPTLAELILLLLGQHLLMSSTSFDTVVSQYNVNPD